MAATARFSPQAVDSVSRLRSIAACAGEVSADRLAHEATALAERLAEGRFHVACLGQFKRGKSTLLNALVGESVLPTGVVPITSAVTVLRAGLTRAVRVHFENGSAADVPAGRLREYVTEEGNPGNAKAVVAVDVYSPSAILRGGLCLVDTPGIGSSSPLASDVTRAFVPHVDAALVVLGADPPISGEELGLLEQVRADTRPFVFAINKADKLNDAELIEVVGYTQRRLMDRLGVMPESLFVVSAAERLERGLPTRDWARLEQAIAGLADAPKGGWLDWRARSTTERLGRQIVQAIDAVAHASSRPMADGEQRLRELRAWLADAQDALSDFGLLLAAEQQAVALAARDGAAGRAANARATAVAELTRAFESSPAGLSRLRRVAFGIAQEIARKVVRQQIAVVEDETERAYRAAVGRFIRLANEFLERLSRAEPRLAELPPLEPPVQLGGPRRFHFTDLMALTSATAWQWLLESVGPPSWRRARLTARVQAYLERLLDSNSSRVVGDLVERLEESRRDLESEIRWRLTELVASAERALGRARELRATGERAMTTELERLESVRRRVEAIVPSAAQADRGDATA